jgi:tetratricopeptide (TPR) repeat protein
MMIRVVQTGPKRLALVVIALVVAFALSYFGIRNALASYYSNQGTLEGFEKATRLEPSNPENWYRLGKYFQNDLEHADTQRAIQAYRTSLSLSPTLAKSWAELASVYEGEGHLDAARQALDNAKRAYPLSADIAWRHGNFLLRSGELNQAFREIGRAVELDPVRGWEAFSVLQHFESDDSAILNRFPRQEKVYLDIIGGLNRQGRTDSALKVWHRLFALDEEMARKGLKREKFEITQDTLFSLENQLLARNSVTEAWQVWREALTFMEISKPPGPPESLVWDGGFETEIVDGGFSWRISSPVGSAVSFNQSVRHSGARAVTIKFDGKHDVNFQGVCQLMVVNPETAYDFSGWLRTDNVTSDKGIFFRLSAPQNKESQAFTPQLTGTHPWTQFKLRWTSPKDGRLLQICVVREPSYESYDTIAGTVWVDDVELVPIKTAKSSASQH